VSKSGRVREQRTHGRRERRVQGGGGRNKKETHRWKTMGVCLEDREKQERPFLKRKKQ